MDLPLVKVPSPAGGAAGAPRQPAEFTPCPVVCPTSGLATLLPAARAANLGEAGREAHREEILHRFRNGWLVRHP